MYAPVQSGTNKLLLKYFMILLDLSSGYFAKEVLLELGLYEK